MQTVKSKTNTPSFATIANAAINKIQDQVEAKFPTIESKSSSGVFSFKANGGEYVVNRQIPESQIWLSSPLSGATHYDYVNGSFVDRHRNMGLSELLQAELKL